MHITALKIARFLKVSVHFKSIKWGFCWSVSAYDSLEQFTVVTRSVSLYHLVEGLVVFGQEGLLDLNQVQLCVYVCVYTRVCKSCDVLLQINNISIQLM